MSQWEQETRIFVEVISLFSRESLDYPYNNT